jgi:hypothetical protein
MSKVLHEIPKLQVVSACFSKLANKTYYGQWGMNDRWPSLNYSEGTNAAGIMWHDYKPHLTINGVEKKRTVNCFVALPPFAAEPLLNPGQSWWQMRICVSNRKVNFSII